MTQINENPSAVHMHPYVGDIPAASPYYQAIRGCSDEMSLLPDNSPERDWYERRIKGLQRIARKRMADEQMVLAGK